MNKKTNTKNKTETDTTLKKAMTSRYAYWGALTLLILAGIWLRTDDLLAYHRQPQRAFHNSRPILMNFDGYYYLSAARDILQGTYGEYDPLRGVPESPVRPVPPPLISVIAAGVAAATGFSLDWIAAVLPALFGVALACPLAFFGRLYGGRAMVLVSVGMSLFATYYVYRTNVGWFDTDCLNVTFVILICYCFVRFGLQQGLRRYIPLAGGVCAFALFLLWWDQTPAIVALISLTPLLMVLLLLYRPPGRERWIAFALMLFVAAGLLVWKGGDLVFAPFRAVFDQWFYIAKQQVGDFPNIGASISEQKRAPLAELVSLSTGNWISFAAGLGGMGWLAWCKRKAAAPLVVPFALGMLSLFFARRFLIFLNPFLAMGCGYLVHRLWTSSYRRDLCRLFAVAMGAVFIVAPLSDAIGKTYWPKEIPPIVEGMDKASALTPEDSVLWAWWDHGYPIVYWSQRATISDGSLHGGLRTVCNAIPLSAHSERLAANFMHFYVTRGLSGIEKVFKAGGGPEPGMRLLFRILSESGQAAQRSIAQAGLAPVDQWEDFFFPEPARDVYLFLDLRVARTAYWWHWFGTWDTSKHDGVHGKFKLFRRCVHKDRTIVGPGMVADLSAGTVSLANGVHKLSSAWVLDGVNRREHTFGNADGLVLTFDARTRTASVTEKEFSRTLFFKLFMMGRDRSDLFDLKAGRFPYYQIWKVQAPERMSGAQ